jgi:hypothetical protein
MRYAPTVLSNLQGKRGARSQCRRYLRRDAQDAAAVNIIVRNQPAIVVTPLGALRIDEGSFMEQGMSQGLNISLKHKEDMAPRVIEEGTAPGFDAL